MSNSKNKQDKKAPKLPKLLGFGKLHEFLDEKGFPRLKTFERDHCIVRVWAYPSFFKGGTSVWITILDNTQGEMERSCLHEILRCGVRIGDVIPAILDKNGQSYHFSTEQVFPKGAVFENDCSLDLKNGKITEKDCYVSKDKNTELSM